jgi:hypothetical protein
VGEWSVESVRDEEGLTAAQVWAAAYADASAWPRWNAELAGAVLDGPLRLGATARLHFATGLQATFRVTVFEEERVFTDEGRLASVWISHRHELQPLPGGGVRMTNRMVFSGRLAGAARMFMRRAALRTVSEGQTRAAALARLDAPA